MENESSLSDSGALKSSETSLDIPLVFVDPAGDEISKVEEISGIEKDTKSSLAHAKLTIERGASVGEVFLLSAEDSNIGRWDADNGIFPDVDLDAHDPEAKVSRKHARIIHQAENYVLEDLGSTNGTFINRGRRLLPGNKEMLKDGDEIIVGKTFLRFKVLI